MLGGQHPRPLSLALLGSSPKGRASGETVHFATQPETAKSAVPEGFPRSGEAVEKRSDETDEGAPPAAAYPYPSSGAARHPFPLLSPCDIFPRPGEICPQGVKALAAAGKLPGKEQSLQARQRLPLRGSWQNRQVLTEGVCTQKSTASSQTRRCGAPF